MKHTVARCAILGLVLLAALGCGKKETPEQKLETLRFNHEIIPVGVTTLNADTNPTLMVDLQVVNKGAIPLSSLTVLLRVTAADGNERLRQRHTLGLEGVRPGVGERRSAVVEGFTLAEGDQVFVELEPNLPPDELRTLPEFADVADEEGDS